MKCPFFRLLFDGINDNGIRMARYHGCITHGVVDISVPVYVPNIGPFGVLHKYRAWRLVSNRASHTAGDDIPRPLIHLHRRGYPFFIFVIKT